MLKAYPNHPAILVTHAYLYRDGNRYDINISKVTHQDFIPQDYGYTASQGINDGEMMWQKLVLPNPNVRMVFSGHDTGSARLTSARPDGSVVHQMLSDYQWWTDDTHQDGSFGYGWLRIVRPRLRQEDHRGPDLLTIPPALSDRRRQPVHAGVESLSKPRAR